MDIDNEIQLRSGKVRNLIARIPGGYLLYGMSFLTVSILLVSFIFGYLQFPMTKDVSILYSGQTSYSVVINDDSDIFIQTGDEFDIYTQEGELCGKTVVISADKNDATVEMTLYLKLDNKLEAETVDEQILILRVPTRPETVFHWLLKGRQ